MMSELLAMLTPGAPPIDAEIRGTSGQRITPSDVAACLAHVDRYTYLYALSKFCLDDHSRAELNDLAIEDAVGRGYTFQSQEPDDSVERLGLLALSFSISPSRCQMCKGTGQVTAASKVDSCPKCQGTGNMQLSARRLADAMGAGRWRSQKVWMPRFQTLLSDYQVKDDAIQTVLYLGLRDE